MGSFTALILLSMAIAQMNTGYTIDCEYTINTPEGPLLVHEGTPKDPKAGWAGLAYANRIVLNHGIDRSLRPQVFAHEYLHWKRLNNGSFSLYDKANEELLAYEYSEFPLDWHSDIQKFRCIDV